MKHGMLAFWIVIATSPLSAQPWVERGDDWTTAGLRHVNYMGERYRIGSAGPLMMLGDINSTGAKLSHHRNGVPVYIYRDGYKARNVSVLRDGVWRMVFEDGSTSSAMSGVKYRQGDLDRHVEDW